MECEKVRDQFSSFSEKELNPMEERIVREHLASCPECQRDLEQFDKMLRWLHCADQVEVPNGFLSEILEKMKAQKRKAPMGERGSWRWFEKALSLKLPIQAVAMVIVLFLAIYLIKIMPPVGVPHLRSVEQTKSRSSEEKRVETEPFRKEANKERIAGRPPLGTPQLQGVEQAKKSPQREKGTEIKESRKENAVARPHLEAPQVKGIEQTESPLAEEKSVEMDLIRKEAKKERAAVQTPLETPRPRETEKTKTPAFSRENIGGVLAAKKEASIALKTPQEINLRISDREQAFSQLHALVEQFGGEIITEEGNVLLASLPVGSFSEFEKGLRTLSSPEQPSEVAPLRHEKGPVSFSSKVERGEIGKKDEVEMAMTNRKNHIVVRIILFAE